MYLWEKYILIILDSCHVGRNHFISILERDSNSF
jgi:hypothetical protein